MAFKIENTPNKKAIQPTGQNSIEALLKKEITFFGDTEFNLKSKNHLEIEVFNPTQFKIDA